MLARVMNMRFPPSVKAEVVGVARGLVPIMKEQRGFNGLQVMTNPNAGEGVMVSFWETEADAEASEASPSYIGQMSMMSSFLSERLAPETYEVDVRT
jgi:heme-degrading monooxygenase HmoA